MLIWFVVWAIALIVFLSIPICMNAESRRRWMIRLRTCRWKINTERSNNDNNTNNNNRSTTTGTATTSAVNNSNNENNNRNQSQANGQADDGEAFHYVLSRAQEDEIRESFLIESLSLYTKQLTASDIIQPPSVSNSKDDDDNDDDDDASPNPANDDEGSDKGQQGNEASNDIEKAKQGGNSLSAEAAAAAAEAAAAKKRAFSYDSGCTDECSFEASGFALDSDDIFSEGGHRINVPPAGWTSRGGAGSPSSSSPSKEENDTSASVPPVRHAPNGCAICLSSYEPDDRITWSSNEACNHVFHNECILDWLNASGRKALRRQRRQEEQQGIVNYANHPVLKITKFPMLCPCCRQDFVSKQNDVGNLIKKNTDNRGGGGWSSSVPSSADGAATTTTTPPTVTTTTTIITTITRSIGATSAAVVTNSGSGINNNNNVVDREHEEQDHTNSSTVLTTTEGGETTFEEMVDLEAASTSTLSPPAPAAASVVVISDDGGSMPPLTLPIVASGTERLPESNRTFPTPSSPHENEAGTTEIDVGLATVQDRV